MLVQHEYKRCGPWGYLAALDVHSRPRFDRCEAKNGIAPVDRLVEQVVTRPPYDEARRVFWIVDNCSAHRGCKPVQRFQSRYPRLVLVHASIQASWLNQVEIYFSIVQREILTLTISQALKVSPNDCLIFSTTGKQRRGRSNVKFTRQYLSELMNKLRAAKAPCGHPERTARTASFVLTN
jgi:DDE superfamily endonuclease